MRKFFALIIGLTIAFSGIHFMPAHAMEKGMGDMNDMKHCFLCSEVDRQKNDECPTDIPGETNNEPSFDDPIPFWNNCDCDFKQGEKNHASLLPCKPNQTKQKIFTAVLPKFEFVIKKETYAISQKSIASQPTYLKAHKTIQKLE